MYDCMYNVNLSGKAIRSARIKACLKICILTEHFFAESKLLKIFHSVYTHSQNNLKNVPNILKTSVLSDTTGPHSFSANINV